MLSVYAAGFDSADPMSQLRVGEQPTITAPDDWAVVNVRAAALNHKDLLALEGIGMRAAPMILGTDGAGLDENGNRVAIHACIPTPGWVGDETMDPRRRTLGTHFNGTFAEQVAVPRRNLIALPDSMSFEHAACLPTAFLTAYRMLFGRGNVKPGDLILIQGAGGGVSTALITLAAAAGVQVWATSRDPKKQRRALELGADRVFESNSPLPTRVDAVMESVGKATWRHSLESLKPGGTLVTCGATSGYTAATEINRVFFLQQSIIGSTLGTTEEFAALLQFMEKTKVRPTIDTTMPLAEARGGFEKMRHGDLFGKIVFSL